MIGESQSFQFSVDELGRCQPMTKAEEAKIGKRILEGDDDAVHYMVRRNLRFVISMAVKYLPYGHPVEDMVQDGAIGMIDAARKFDYRLGNRFISYAVWDVRQRIQRGIAVNSRAVKLPDNTLGMMQRISKAMEGLYQAGNPDPLPEVVAEKAGLRAVEAEAGMCMRGHATRLDAYPSSPGGGEFATTRKDFISDESLPPNATADTHGTARSIQTILGVLTERERAVISMRFGLDGGEGMTLEAIANAIGKSRERARQLERGALEKLAWWTDGKLMVDLGAVIDIDAGRVRAARKKARASHRARLDKHQRQKLARKVTS